jgi:hypothetical protein
MTKHHEAPRKFLAQKTELLLFNIIVFCDSVEFYLASLIFGENNRFSNQGAVVHGNVQPRGDNRPTQSIPNVIKAP